MKYTYEYKVTVTLDENDASKFEADLQRLVDNKDVGDGADVFETDATEYSEPEIEGQGSSED